MDRRSFMGSILALAAAPAIVRADSLMRIVPRDATVLTSLDDYEEGIWPQTPCDGDNFDGILIHRGNVPYTRVGAAVVFGTLLHNGIPLGRYVVVEAA